MHIKVQKMFFFFKISIHAWEPPGPVSCEAQREISSLKVWFVGSNFDASSYAIFASSKRARAYRAAPLRE